MSKHQLQVVRGPCEPHDAAIETDAVCLRQVAFGDRDLASARRAGALRLEGDEALAARFLASFQRPAPVAARSGS
ncbi:MAG: hypothetical protein ACTHU0_35710 [Kofleriaceae bacterium]